MWSPTPPRAETQTRLPQHYVLLSARPGTLNLPASLAPAGHLEVALLFCNWPGIPPGGDIVVPRTPGSLSHCSCCLGSELRAPRPGTHSQDTAGTAGDTQDCLGQEEPPVSTWQRAGPFLPQLPPLLALSSTPQGPPSPRAGGDQSCGQAHTAWAMRPPENQSCRGGAQQGQGSTAATQCDPGPGGGAASPIWGEQERGHLLCTQCSR